MSAELATSDSGYTNRPSMGGRAAHRLRLDGSTGRNATGRAMDRMRLTLYAYEQRAERRAAFHAWLAARGALTPAAESSRRA